MISGFMTGSRSGVRIVAFGIVGLVLACLAQPVFASSLERVRYSTSEERTRVVLDLNRSEPFTHRTLPSPPRIVVELTQSETQKVEPSYVNNGFVRRVRVNALRGRTQVVLDLEKPLDYSIFTLENPVRIVIDVKHSGSPVAPEETPEPVVAEKKAPPREESGKTSPVEVAVKTPVPETPVKKDLPPPVVTPPSRDQWVVAIDAGHGGEDHGARHHGTSEKDITLELAREVMKELERRPGIKPILVRKGDYFIPLRRRWTLAEKQGADLFVSIHCNASKDKKAEGTEVYFVSLKGATDETARELAQRENAVDEKMGVDVPDTELDDIIRDMMQTDVLAKSQMLAEGSLNHLYELGTVYGRGVKQAGFAVLKSPRMPSILVEAAFISNSKEVKLLRDSDWRGQFGARLADGIEAYIRSVDTAEKVGVTGQ